MTLSYMKKILKIKEKTRPVRGNKRIQQSCRTQNQHTKISYVSIHHQFKNKKLRKEFHLQ